MICLVLHICFWLTHMSLNYTYLSFKYMHSWWNNRSKTSHRLVFERSPQSTLPLQSQFCDDILDASEIPCVPGFVLGESSDTKYHITHLQMLDRHGIYHVYCTCILIWLVTGLKLNDKNKKITILWVIGYWSLSFSCKNILNIWPKHTWNYLINYQL